MVLLHGFAQNAHSWDYTSLALSQKYRVLALDTRGHGDSEWAPDSDYSNAAFQRDLDGFIGHLESVPVTIIGLSMGARIAYVYAGRRPSNVRNLVIVDSGPPASDGRSMRQKGGRRRIMDFVRLPDQMDTWEEFVERIHQYNPRRSMQEVRDTLVHKVRRAPNGKWTWKYDSALRDPDRPRESMPAAEQWGYLEAVTCPTLIVRGQDSDVMSSETAAEMARRMQRCQVVEIERSGHLVPGDNPVRFISVVLDWMSSLHDIR